MFGNIRVFCRCRILSKTKVAARHAIVVDFDAAKDGKLGILTGGSTKKKFSFDRVYIPEDDQGFDHLKKLSEWVVDDRVRPSVIGARFGAFLDLSLPKHDHALLLSLVEHYDVSERCVVFNDVKLHFGLEDVWHIKGLPVDGETVTGVEGNPIQLSEEYLGDNLYEGNRGAIKLDTLKKQIPEGTR
ncbi:hypothetical protein RHGRI_003373 [Rhododendron griersonianum]|uniref:DUF7745 domain-containing protein n=1 Tax=Rhododendron griersonianum TaxID=479676 RepID=A0AAV6L5W7_9ERIC|nr:hypothetical protein RHGRI_003373 [Rhododendron griersonianum]